MDQVLTRRHLWFGDEKKTKSGGPVPMDLDALQMSQKSGEHFDSMDSGEQPSNAFGDEQSGDTAELNALRKGGFLGKCHHCGQFDTRYLNAERRMKKWQRKEGRKRQKQLGVQRGERQHAPLESLVARGISRQRLEPERRLQLDKWKVVGEGYRQ